MPTFSEKSLVEDHFIEKLQAKGWTFVAPETLERESLDEALLVPNLTRAVKKINDDIGIGDEEIRQVLNELKLKGSGIEAEKQILNYLKIGVPIKFEKERLVKYVRLFDYDSDNDKDRTENNEFIVSRQTTHISGDKQIRNDIILYVNGIPLVNIECKNPASFAERWFDAYTQIKEYERSIPELYKYVQLGVAAREVAKYFPIVPWQDDVRIHEWREPQLDSIDSTIEMLAPATLLNIVKNYFFFRIEHGSATKVVTRYMQYRAAEKVYNRVIGYIKDSDAKNKGLVWHWQGSGKTLTMIFAANKLYNAKELENPTIFFIVDREELEEQLFEEFTALDIPKPEIIGSIEALRSVIKYDEARGKRGVLITLIHKFRPEELRELQKELEKMSNETISTRKNVIAIIDEGHRTQYGTLAAQMRHILKKASFFAFTGTPISKKGRDTYLEFGYPPKDTYLDKYFVVDSIEDGFTVKIVYQPRLEKDVHLKKELLEAFLDVELDEIPEELRQKVEDRVKKKLNVIRIFLENPDRIKKVAKDVADHFNENLDGKYKGMVVAVSRKACVLYKRALDELLPKEYSEVVMTFERKDPEVIKDYLDELRTRYPGKEIEDIRKEIVQKFKEEEYPKILIVTDMLLTGFDVPMLQTLYLDKPLKEHRLLQAIARTNRPYKDVKEAGLVLDYVGMLKQVVKAFEIYSKEDIKGALWSVEDVRREFVRDMNETLKMFEGIPKDRFDREIMLKAIEVLTSKDESSKKFMENYKRLRKNFELLGPDEVKLELLSDYKWLSSVYTYYTVTVLRNEPEEERYARKFYGKTLKYVYKSTELENLQKELPVIAFDANYLRNLDQKVKSREERAANIVFTLNRFVLVDKNRSPVYESLAERVEHILELWKEKTKDFEKIYREGAQIVSEINKLAERQKELGFTDVQYSMLLALEEKFGDDKSLVDDVRELSTGLAGQTFKGWYLQQSARKNVEREVRRFVRRYLKRRGLALKDLDDLYGKLIERVYDYGTKG